MTWRQAWSDYFAAKSRVGGATRRKKPARRRPRAKARKTKRAPPKVKPPTVYPPAEYDVVLRMSLVSRDWNELVMNFLNDAKGEPYRPRTLSPKVRCIVQDAVGYLSRDSTIVFLQQKEPGSDLVMLRVRVEKPTDSTEEDIKSTFGEGALDSWMEGDNAIRLPVKLAAAFFSPNVR
jgi:hypothetical protein